ncbi:lantibiotic dehydratase [Actinomadura craniellae]|uniref:Lantibiotic dehydratase n=1 Tax=Actinomadura craniellae TaxID=2231787 RepID=A0A365HDL8_9ACTN|nr:lantibiotic dehydratase [Actinomadura craniellae]
MYEAVDAALIRTTTAPADLDLPPWPDLTCDDPAGWRSWMRQVWALTEFADAVRDAAPDLAFQVDRHLDASPAGGDQRLRRLRRIVEALARYLLRWTTRATPYGRFAGVAPITFGPVTAVRSGENHRVVHRPSGQGIEQHADQVERRPDLVRRVPVMTNPLGYARGRVWIVPCASADTAGTSDVEIDLTAPVRLAVDAARRPILFADLAAELAAEAPSVAPPMIDALLAGLLAHRALVSAARPAMTATDPTAHLTQHAVPAPDGRVMTDVRINDAVTLPPAVLREAERAATALTRIAPPMPVWEDYHRAFLDRYGPGAAVPVRELVGDTGLGFPAGYRSSRRRTPDTLTPLDLTLAQLAQQAALDGRTVVDLDEGLARRLAQASGQGLGREPVPHTELRFHLAAESQAEVDGGRFTLTVISGARHAGVSTGRFLYLLDAADLDRFRATYRNLPTTMPGALTVQLSGPPLMPAMTGTARVPELLPKVLPVGEFGEGAVSLDNLAVTGDAHRLWLVSPSREFRPVEPLLFNAVDLPAGQQPLLRFLAEIPYAWSAPCCPFTWGNIAGGLPFLPAIRYGRSVLSPAHWTVPAAALPGRGASWSTWRHAWEQLSAAQRIPDAALLGDRDVRVRLDLTEPAHLALLRSHLDRNPTAPLTQAPGPAGWIDGRAHEITLTLTRRHTMPPSRTSRPVRLTTTLRHHPGRSPWLSVHLHGRTDDVLTRLGGLVDGVDGWWFIRYPTPGQVDQHLRLRIPLPGPDAFAGAAARLADWATALHDDGLLFDYTITTYRPEPRFGTGLTLAAAHQVFAADSRAALTLLAAQQDRSTGTAAGMLHIADGFTLGDGERWLIDHVDHRGGPPLRDRLPAARPSDERLRAALAGYRAAIDHDGLDPDQALADLLHLHHARTIGVDPDSERYCLRLARAAARAHRAQSSL